jgi:hypothetical protein
MPQGGGQSGLLSSQATNAPGEVVPHIIWQLKFELGGGHVLVKHCTNCLPSPQLQTKAGWGTHAAPQVSVFPQPSWIVPQVAPAIAQDVGTQPAWHSPVLNEDMIASQSSLEMLPP